MNIYNIFLFFQAYFAFVNCYLKHVADYDLKLLSGQNTPDIIKIQEERASLWPLGIISYYLDANSYDEIIAQRVYSVMDAVQSASCVKFNPVMTKPDNITWLHITNPQKTRECVHKNINFYDQEITVVLGYDCLKESDILHALLHAIGLKDEVTHPHRDRYLRVLWNNIRPEYRQLYQMQGLDSSKVLTEYDPTSIMHFHDRAFSSNGQATIVPLISGLMIAPSNHLSQMDTMKLRLLFEHECNKRKVSDVIDSCKNAFHANLKSTVIPMAKILENGDINEATNDRFIDKSNQEKVNSKSKEKVRQSYETEINDDDSNKSESDTTSALNDRLRDTREETTVKDRVIRNGEYKTISFKNKNNKAMLLSLHSLKTNRSLNIPTKKNKVKLLSLNSLKTFKDKNSGESLHLKSNSS